MNKLKTQKLKLLSNWLRFFPYVGLGVLIFCLNSGIGLNSWFRGYLTLIESQIGLVALYFVIKRFWRKPKSVNDLAVDNFSD